MTKIRKVEKTELAAAWDRFYRLRDQLEDEAMDIDAPDRVTIQAQDFARLAALEGQPAPTRTLSSAHSPITFR